MRLINQLKRHEGVERKPYVDTVGKLTIGVGRNLDDVGLSDDEIEYLLSNDIKVASLELHMALPFTKLMDGVRHDALVNMVFNMGISRFKDFKKTIAYLERADYERASTEMMDSKWARQVGNRAKELSEQVRTGREI